MKPCDLPNSSTYFESMRINQQACESNQNIFLFYQGKHSRVKVLEVCMCAFPMFSIKRSTIQTIFNYLINIVCFVFWLIVCLFSCWYFERSYIEYSALHANCSHVCRMITEWSMNTMLVNKFVFFTFHPLRY